ncbi:CBS domain containing-hemolysin-like protein [Trueperella bonasi]|uniref:CBS domain containing-hemolysin-like protein n=1 Tax=Trueperella bonasi TaxID=312286 RepID=A0ABT9NH48_9ACTO|nr:hemolysin family protein [Trueperella bonasi]MDP9806734.1 CBS domain containing-hemolysin-like protein [Trueperella bonasi]
MSIGTALIVTGVLLAINAFFVGAEFSVMGARRSRVEPLAEQGKKTAQITLYALENVTLMLATCQLGITVCSVALGAISEPAIAHWIEGPLAAVGVPEGMVHPIAIVIALVLVVYLHVVLGEMVPKNLAVTTPEKVSYVLVPPLVAISKLLLPIVHSLNWFANRIISLLGFEPKDEVGAAFTVDEVASIVDASKKAGVLDADVGLISSALEFTEYSAGDLMVPIADLTTVSPLTTPAEVELEIARTGFSRYPVKVQDELVGYIHLKDIIDISASRREEPIAPWKIRKMSLVDSSDEVESALRSMQKDGTHLAAVSVNGAVEGVLFLEDILEELVGEVRDAMQK